MVGKDLSVTHKTRHYLCCRDCNKIHASTPSRTHGGSHEDFDLVGYTDADWAGDRDNRKSTSGYSTLVGGNLVTWKSKKQTVFALSSAEAKFKGIAKGVRKCYGLVSS